MRPVCSSTLRSSSLSRDSMSLSSWRSGCLVLVALMLFSLFTSQPLGASGLLEHTPYVTDGASVRLIFSNADT